MQKEKSILKNIMHNGYITKFKLGDAVTFSNSDEEIKGVVEQIKITPTESGGYTSIYCVGFFNSGAKNEIWSYAMELKAI